jgi:hypothetical protein
MASGHDMSMAKSVQWGFHQRFKQFDGETSWEKDGYKDKDNKG